MKLREFQEKAEVLFPAARVRQWRPEYEPNVVYDVVAESDRFAELVPGPEGTPRAVFLRPERGMVYLSPDMIPPVRDLSSFPPYRAAVQNKRASLKAWSRRKCRLVQITMEEGWSFFLAKVECEDGLATLFWPANAKAELLTLLRVQIGKKADERGEYTFDLVEEPWHVGSPDFVEEVGSTPTEASPADTRPTLDELKARLLEATDTGLVAQDGELLDFGAFRVRLATDMVVMPDDANELLERWYDLPEFAFHDWSAEVRSSWGRSACWLELTITDPDGELLFENLLYLQASDGAMWVTGEINDPATVARACGAELGAAEDLGEMALGF